MKRTDGSSRPGRRGFLRGDRTWHDVALCRSAWRENQPHELNETVPAGSLGLDLVALGFAAILAGVGLHLLVGSPESAKVPTAHVDADFACEPGATGHSAGRFAPRRQPEGIAR